MPYEAEHANRILEYLQMRIGRIEFGTIVYHGSAKPNLKFIIDKGACGCNIVGFWRLYLTWISKECAKEDFE